MPPKPSCWTIRRILNDNGMASVRPIKKPLLSALHKEKRLNFAKAHAKYGKWNRVVFSDEKIFKVIAGGHVRCWYKKGDSRFIAKYLTPTVGHPQQVMVWAAIDSEGRICIKRCPGHVRAAEYQAVLGSAIRFIKRRCSLCPNHSVPLHPVHSCTGITPSCKMGHHRTEPSAPSPG